MQEIALEWLADHHIEPMVTEPGAAIIYWCNGFMLGVGHYKPAWESWFKDTRRMNPISLIMGMSDPEILRHAENAIEEETALEAIARVGELVPLIHSYWAFESALDGYLADRD
jgi:hypothetical protein